MKLGDPIPVEDSVPSTSSTNWTHLKFEYWNKKSRETDLPRSVT